MGAKISSWIFFNITGETNKIGFGMLPGVADFLSELNSLNSGQWRTVTGIGRITMTDMVEMIRKEIGMMIEKSDTEMTGIGTVTDPDKMTTGTETGVTVTPR